MAYSEQRTTASMEAQYVNSFITREAAMDYVADLWTVGDYHVPTFSLHIVNGEPFDHVDGICVR